MGRTRDSHTEDTEGVPWRKGENENVVFRKPQADSMSKRKKGSLVSNDADTRRKVKIWEYSLVLVKRSLVTLTRTILVESWDQTHIEMNWQLSLDIFQSRSFSCKHSGSHLKQMYLVCFFNKWRLEPKINIIWHRVVMSQSSNISLIPTNLWFSSFYHHLSAVF